MGKTAHDIVEGLRGLSAHGARKIAYEPTGVPPGYHPILGAAVTEDGRLRSVTQGVTPLIIDAIYTMSTTNTVLGDSTPKRLNFNHQEHDPLGQVTTGASWAFTAQAAGVYLFLVNAPLSIGGGVDWLAADRADLSLQGDVNEVVCTWVGVGIAAEPGQLRLDGLRPVVLDVGDVVYAQIVQDCGTDRNVDEAIAAMVIAHV